MGATLWQDALFPHLLANAPRTLRSEADVAEANNLLLDEQFHTLLQSRRYRASRTQSFGSEVRASIQEILALVAASDRGAP